MGEIIRFDFNKNKKVDNSEEDSKIPKAVGVDTGVSLSEENKIKENDILFKKFVHFVISDAHKRFKNLEIKQLPYNEAKNIVKDYTNEQLVNWIVNSNESDWVAKPSFYKAVYFEIKSRLPDRYNKE